MDWDYASRVATDPSLPMQQGNLVLESLARQEALRALLAFSELHVRIQDRRAMTQGADWDLFQTERFVLDEVLQLICERTQAITQADGVVIALGEGTEFVCRAAAGSLPIERGMCLLQESEFLQDCLDSGRILRCDDCNVDTRVELDLSRQLGACSTVIVPLRGKRARIGVLQAFARTPFAFSDSHVRCFDLFAELVLSSIKPGDQDRRLYWLADVADEILKPKPIPVAVVAEQAVEEKIEERAEPLAAEPETPPVDGVVPEPEPELPDLAVIEKEPADRQEEIPPLAFLSNLETRSGSRPGLTAVIGLVAVVALFSAGVWWGMQNNPASARVPASTAPTVLQPATASSSAVAPASDHLLDSARPDLGMPPSSSTAAKLSVLPKVTGVRHWSSPLTSTVVIDMEDQVPYEIHRLMSPERIYFDLHDTALVPELEGKTIEIGDLPLARVRVAQPVTGITRVVLDTKDGSNFSVSMESNPYRLVVQLRGSDRPAEAARLDLPGSSLRSRQTQAALLPLPQKPEENQLRARAGRFRIVLDAGHGGWDLGTVGREGLLEKDLVLDVTQRLGRLLQNRLDAQVIFTRTSDVYLPLDQRTDFANQSQADLFVSVHANYSSSAAARGVETYYTNLYVPAGATDAGKEESGASPHLVQAALSASELQEKNEESRHLAASVQRSLYATLAANSPGIRDRGTKESSFVVLTGTTMPSILTEISFVSSPADERNLQNAGYRQQIAEAIYKGIARYEAAAHHVKVAQVQPNTTRR